MISRPRCWKPNGVSPCGRDKLGWPGRARQVAARPEPTPTHRASPHRRRRTRVMTQRSLLEVGVACAPVRRGHSIVEHGDRLLRMLRHANSSRSPLVPLRVSDECGPPGVDLGTGSNGLGLAAWATTGSAQAGGTLWRGRYGRPGSAPYSACLVEWAVDGCLGLTHDQAVAREHHSISDQSPPTKQSFPNFEVSGHPVTRRRRGRDSLLVEASASFVQ